MADEEPPRRRGIRTVGGELQISNLSIMAGVDGEVTMGQPHAKLRTDMWPFWVEDAIEAADIACQMADQIPALVAQLDDAGELKDQIEREIDGLTIRELRATMRAITASAFAIDAFYATVKARCGPHPDEEKWRDKGTSRKRCITETIRYHLKINPPNVEAVKSCVAQVFTLRDWAAHMVVEFRDAVYRPDVEADVDWHFDAFRSQNAVSAVHYTVMILDYLVSILDRGGEELAKGCKPLALERMDAIFRAYEQVGLPEFQRAGKQVPST